tara:strand:- start:832 stop:1344 length:513 start_codon:yes stop_codon:yes gene_type:complete
MQSVAHLKYLRIAPRKVRLVADLVRGKKVREAQHLLEFARKKGATPVLKTLNSALNSARNNFQAEESNLYVAKIMIAEGPKLKRFRARARGMAAPIQKKTSHITIILDEIEQGKGKARAKSIKKEPLVVKKAVNDKEKSDIPRPRVKPELEAKRPREPRGIQKFFRRKSV